MKLYQLIASDQVWAQVRPGTSHEWTAAQLAGPGWSYAERPSDQDAYRCVRSFWYPVFLLRRFLHYRWSGLRIWCRARTTRRCPHCRERF